MTRPTMDLSGPIPPTLGRPRPSIKPRSDVRQLESRLGFKAGSLHAIEIREARSSEDLISPASPYLAMGIDPGFRSMGIALIEMTSSSQRIVVAQTITTEGDDHAERKVKIARELYDLVRMWKPAAIGYEIQSGVEVAAQREGGKDGGAGSNHSSRRVHEIVGMIEMLALVTGTPLYPVAPSTAKVAIAGKGGARRTKRELGEVVRRIYKLKRTNEHVVAAVGVTLAAYRQHLLETIKRERRSTPTRGRKRRAS